MIKILIFFEWLITIIVAHGRRGLTLSNFEPNTQSNMSFTNSPSSASVASRLYFNGRRSSGRNSFESDSDLMSFSDSEYQMDIHDISSRVSTISRKVDEIEDFQSTKNEENLRLRTENAVMSQRVHLLEEQLAQCELRWREKIDDLVLRSKDALKRCEMEKQLELERCKCDNRILEKELSHTKKENLRLDEEVKRMSKQIDNLSVVVNDLKFHCADLEEEKKTIHRKFLEYQEKNQSDVMDNSEIMDQPANENANSEQDFISNQIYFLEEENVELKRELKRLAQQNEDLQAELLHNSAMRGGYLLDDKFDSLADELNKNSSPDLKKALKEQEICNQQLRAYINGILMRVVEIHPEILEIKNREWPLNRVDLSESLP
uniref:FIP-RBD domain-containing protein n=1 Tax=Strongyloides papillosus TaxID=174720 RepID=A0A0N5B6S0_STREA